MTALVLSLLLAGSDGDFLKTLEDVAKHTKCEATQILKTTEDDGRAVFFLCPDARCIIVFGKTPEGAWKPVSQPFWAPFTWPEATVAI